ncbi:MAG: NAD(P)-dependent oxidoreductase, partial [Candidatus Sericytochromatia bacterium]
MPNSQPQVSGETKTFRVLIADPIEASGLAALEGVAAVDIKTGLPAEALEAIIGEYDALMVRSQTKVTAAIIEAGAKLKIIGRAGVGVDNIDVPAATRRGILVVNSPAGNTIAAAEHSLAMMMALSRHIPAADASTKAGEWKRSKFMGSELYDKTLGVIGLGKIGSHVASVAQALGMKVVAYDPFVTPERASELGVSLASVSELVSLADYVTVHVP